MFNKFNNIKKKRTVTLGITQTSLNPELLLDPHCCKRTNASTAMLMLRASGIKQSLFEVRLSF